MNQNPNNARSVLNCSLISSILFLALSGVSLLAAITSVIAAQCTEQSVSHFWDNLSEINEENVTAGYEAAGNVFAVFFSAFGTILLYCIFIATTLIFIFSIVPSVLGFYFLRKQKRLILVEHKSYHYCKTDAILKIIMSSILLLPCMILIIETQLPLLLFPLLWLLAILGISIACLVVCSRERS